jgi:hypothetical protein
MLQKGCECREGKMEKWKQNWDDVFLNKVKKEGGEGERKGEEREKRETEKNKMS